MFVDSAPLRHRGSGVTVALAVGAALVASCGGSDRTTTPSTAPSIQTSSSESTPALVEHQINLAPFPTIHLVAPASWEALDDWGLTREPCDDCEPTDRAMAIMFWRVTEVYGHPCDWIGTLVEPGVSVDDLATALHTVPTRGASQPEPVSVGGIDGLYMQWSVPDDANFDDCDEGFFESWRADAGGTDRYQQSPGQVDRLWILDVDGERLVIDGFYLPGTPRRDRHELDDIIGSIRFGNS